MTTESMRITVDEMMLSKAKNLSRWVASVPELRSIELRALGIDHAGSLGDMLPRLEEQPAPVLRVMIRKAFLEKDLTKLVGDLKVEEEVKKKILRYVECFRELSQL